MIIIDNCHAVSFVLSWFLAIFHLCNTCNHPNVTSIPVSQVNL